MKSQQLRDLRRDATTPIFYESRADLEKKYKVSQVVDKIRRSLGDNDIDSVIDKYYIESEIPPADVLTELGLWEHLARVPLPVLLISAAGLGYAVCKYFKF